MSSPIRRVTVYCASSRLADPLYRDAAKRLGRELAAHGRTIVYGGGGAGSMGALADGALEVGGHVIGVIPQFMEPLEWTHRQLSEVRIVADMHERKRVMLEAGEAVIALPGGCGTLEELFEAVTWKRLGLYFGPIVMVNTRGFYTKCANLLEHCVEERFMSERHRAMWSLVEEPEHAVAALDQAPAWDRNARAFAAL
jgi:uncharacterized protein (TIGR00730 family)